MGDNSGVFLLTDTELFFTANLSSRPSSSPFFLNISGGAGVVVTLGSRLAAAAAQRVFLVTPAAVYLLDCYSTSAL